MCAIIQPAIYIRRGIVKYLLTSAGVKNASIHNALVGLLGKPIAECSALCIPTASYGHPQVTPDLAWRFISGQEPKNSCAREGLRPMEAAHRARRNARHGWFLIYPHLDNPDLPENTMADAERWAAGMPVPCYAID